MSVQLGRPSTEADPAVSAIVVVTCILTAVGVLLLIRAQSDGGPRHVSVRVDNQTGIPLQIDAEAAGGSTVGLGEAGPRRLTPFVEIPTSGSGGPSWPPTAARRSIESSCCAPSWSPTAG